MERNNFTIVKKKALEEDYLLVYADEASQSVTPRLTRTYALKGKPATITISTEINARLYLASAIGTNGEMDYMIRNKPFDSKAIIEFLEQLLKKLNRKLLIIWDGASIHHSEEVKLFLTKVPENRLFLVKQPHYSPELNADEQVWCHLKNYKLKNTYNRNCQELYPKINSALAEMQKNTSLIASFFRHPELGLI